MNGHLGTAFDESPHTAPSAQSTYQRPYVNAMAEFDDNGRPVTQVQQRSAWKPSPSARAPPATQQRSPTRSQSTYPRQHSINDYPDISGSCQICDGRHSTQTCNWRTEAIGHIHRVHGEPQFPPRSQRQGPLCRLCASTDHRFSECPDLTLLHEYVARQKTEQAAKSCRPPDYKSGINRRDDRRSVVRLEIQLSPPQGM